MIEDKETSIDGYEELDKAEIESQTTDAELEYAELILEISTSNAAAMSNEILQWSTAGDVRHPRYSSMVMHRMVAALWVLNGNFANKHTLREVAGLKGINCTHSTLAKLAKDFSRRFQIKSARQTVDHRRRGGQK